MTPVVAALLALLSMTTVAALLLGRDARRRRRELRHLADYDRLTGLPSRRLLVERVSTALGEGQRTTVRVAVLALEVRGFTYLNETYGREVGDAVMVAVAAVLKVAVRPEDLLVRFGGPRFVVVCPDIGDRAEAEARARALLDVVQRPYEFDRDRIRLTASVGLTVTDHRPTTPEAVLLDATVALEQALDAGKGAIRAFEASPRGAMAPSTAERRLREALDQGEFWLLYLPVLALDDRRLVGVEALLRWADPLRGLADPTGFAHALDETGLVVPVGEWVLREAAAQSRRWQDQFPEHPPIETTVNFSPRQLMQADFVDQVRKTIDETAVDPARLCLELAEAAWAHEPDELWSTLRQAKQLGCRLALADFGQGCTSLHHLTQFKLDRLKITRSFIADLPHSHDDRAIVEHLVALAHDLGMVPVAEGIDSAEQAVALLRLGCSLGQGPYFSTPQPPEVITSLLAGGAISLDETPVVVVDVTTTTASRVPRQLA